MFPINFLGSPIPLNQLFLKAVQGNKVMDGTFSRKNCRLNPQDIQRLLEAMKYNVHLDSDIDVLIKINGIKDSDSEYAVLKTIQERNRLMQQSRSPMEPINIYNRYAPGLGIPFIHKPVTSLFGLCKFYFVNANPSAPLARPPLFLPASIIEDIFNARILHLLNKYTKELVFMQGLIKYDRQFDFQQFLQLVSQLDDENMSNVILKQDLRNLKIEEIGAFLREIAKNHHIQRPVTILNLLMVLAQSKSFWSQGPLHKQLADVFRYCDNVRLRNCHSVASGVTSDVAMSPEAIREPADHDRLTPYWVAIDELQQRRLTVLEEDELSDDSVVYEEFDEAASSVNSAAPSASATEVAASRVSGAVTTVEDGLQHHEVADTETHLGSAPKI